MLHAPTPPHPGATPPSQRTESLDILRGLALFGVLLENMQHFVSPPYAEWAFGPGGDGLDRAVVWGVRLLCDNKVYMLFALLFGYGIGLQRARSAGQGFVALELWRMGTLALIGVAHSLLWDGDILLTYALLAVVLLPLQRLGERALHGVALTFLALPAALQLAAWIAASGSPSPLEARLAPYSYPVQQTSFAFAMLAIGFAAGRDRRLSDPRAFLARTQPWLPRALALTVTAHAVALGVMMFFRGPALSWPGLLLATGLAVGAPTLVFVYVVGTLAWLEHPRWQRRLRPLAAVGRTTLTNYLLQSLIGVGLLARVELGTWGPITPPIGVALTIAIFALQVAASRWWLARFQFGPVEWLWRTCTYGQPQPLRVAEAASP